MSYRAVANHHESNQKYPAGYGQVASNRRLGNLELLNEAQISTLGFGVVAPGDFDRSTNEPISWLDIIRNDTERYNVATDQYNVFGRWISIAEHDYGAWMILERLASFSNLNSGRGLGFHEYDVRLPRLCIVSVVDGTISFMCEHVVLKQDLMWFCRQFVAEGNVDVHIVIKHLADWYNQMKHVSLPDAPMEFPLEPMEDYVEPEPHVFVSVTEELDELIGGPMIKSVDELLNVIEANPSIARRVRFNLFNFRGNGDLLLSAQLVPVPPMPASSSSFSPYGRRLVKRKRLISGEEDVCHVDDAQRFGFAGGGFLVDAFVQKRRRTDPSWCWAVGRYGF